MLELSDDDVRPESPPPAPTTSALPAGRKKHTRRKETAAEDAGEQDAPIALGKRRQRAWEENSGECTTLAQLGNLSRLVHCAADMCTCV